MSKDYYFCKAKHRYNVDKFNKCERHDLIIVGGMVVGRVTDWAFGQRFNQAALIGSRQPIDFVPASTNISFDLTLTKGQR